MNSKPRLNCPDRHRACHDSCEKYAAAYKKTPEELKEKRERTEFTEYKDGAVYRMKNTRRSRNGKYSRNGR